MSSANPPFSLQDIIKTLSIPDIEELINDLTAIKDKRLGREWLEANCYSPDWSVKRIYDKEYEREYLLRIGGDEVCTTCPHEWLSVEYHKNADKSTLRIWNVDKDDYQHYNKCWWISCGDCIEWFSVKPPSQAVYNCELEYDWEITEFKASDMGEYMRDNVLNGERIIPCCQTEFYLEHYAYEIGGDRKGWRKSRASDWCGEGRHILELKKDNLIIIGEPDRDNQKEYLSLVNTKFKRQTKYKKIYYILYNDKQYYSFIKPADYDGIKCECFNEHNMWWWLMCMYGL